MLPSAVTNVGEYAFEGCSSLTSLVLPPNFASVVGECAFKNCLQLMSVTFPPPLDPAFIAWTVGSSRNRANWQVSDQTRIHMT